MGSGVIAAPFLTPALDGGEWSASRPGRFTPRGKSSPFPLVKGLGEGNRGGLDAVEYFLKYDITFSFILPCPVTTYNYSNILKL
jgi:hypothetical protein